MAIHKNNLRADLSSIKTVQLTIVSSDRTTVSFGTGSTTLAAGTPLGYDATNNLYGKFVAPAPAQYDIDTGTAGVFALTVNGVATGDIAYNATKAAIEAKFAAIGHVVTATTDGATVNVTFDSEKDITSVPTLVETTAPTATSSAVTAGTSTNGLHNVAAFVWPNAVELDATNNVLGVVMTKGEIYKFAEVEALVDAGDRAALKAQCKDKLLAKGIVVRGIANINQ